MEMLTVLTTILTGVIIFSAGMAATSLLTMHN